MEQKFYYITDSDIEYIKKFGSLVIRNETQTDNILLCYDQEERHLDMDVILFGDILLETY